MGKIEMAIRRRIAEELQARADECLNAAQNPNSDPLAAAGLRVQAIMWEAAAFHVSPEAARNTPANASLQAQEAPVETFLDVETPPIEAAPETPPEPSIEAGGDDVAPPLGGMTPEPLGKVFQARTLPGDRTVYQTKAVRLDKWDVETARAEGWEEYIMVDLERVVYLRRHVAGKPTSSERWSAL